MPRPIIVIPARLASTRLPNKPLVEIQGKPMILRVWEQAMAADIGEVVVACCGAEIADIITEAGGKAILTNPNHPSGTDRIHEAVRSRSNLSKDTIIVNLQGDLPTVSKESLRAVLEPLQNSKVDIGTLAVPISDPKQIENPNVVKIALTFVKPNIGRALYFSRSPIPYGATEYYHHIGIYAYRMSSLERYVSLEPSLLEQTEKLEQLRALEDGMRIDVGIVGEIPHSVDTKEDLEAVARFLGPV
ncbi:MAG: 3-deoxy-manno-octulosonate cytidylyltransferase [Alphaproteobacteria bacterium]|nr:3-deoxy-manno-octulosonate cytidylyltransferase [Alphaproteobacteria bacterium]